MKYAQQRDIEPAREALDPMQGARLGAARDRQRVEGREEQELLAIRHGRSHGSADSGTMRTGESEAR
jgi:hypothetical protein